jgi:hypothetical protein
VKKALSGQTALFFFSAICPYTPPMSLPAPLAMHVQLPKVSTGMQMQPPPLANE